MQRSEGKTIQIQHPDWLAAQAGVKTCTSRYGDRRNEYPIGEVFDFKSNGTSETLKIKILRVDVKEIKDTTSEEAKAVGNYSWVDHINDLYTIYHGELGREFNENTLISLVYFEVIKD